VTHLLTTGVSPISPTCPTVLLFQTLFAPFLKSARNGECLFPMRADTRRAMLSCTQCSERSENFDSLFFLVGFFGCPPSQINSTGQLTKFASYQPTPNAGWKHRTGLTAWAPPDAQPPKHPDPGTNPPEAQPGYSAKDWIDVQLPHDGQCLFRPCRAKSLENTAVRTRISTGFCSKLGTNTSSPRLKGGMYQLSVQRICKTNPTV
jgi:hypothetical protein